LGHLDLPEFPEISHDAQFFIREDMYRKCLNKAFSVIVDSDYGKSRVINKYLLDSERVEVLKFLPAIQQEKEFVDIRKKYNIANQYIFYPAQFWPHKNHIYIVESLSILKWQYGICVSVVFTGSDKGTLDHVMAVAEKLKVKDLVYYLGFVESNIMPLLYKQSIALVMPTYLGPTNIPPLEALSYGVPICYSDKQSFREQLRDAAFYMDLDKPSSLSGYIKQILDGEIDLIKIEESRDSILNDWNEDKFSSKLEGIILKYANIKMRWS